MKTNTFFKTLALDTLRGHWWKAVLLTLVYLLLFSAAQGTASYASLQMSDKMKELTGGSSVSIYEMASVLQDPEYLTIQKKTNGLTSGSFLLMVFVVLPFSVGYVNALRRLLLSGDNRLLGNAVEISTTGYFHKVWGMLLMKILIALWTLLLVIPGIVKTYSYALTPFILEDAPQLSASEAIHRSRMMMRGHKFDLFWLQFSFIGWFFLSILTAGIGFLWLKPYYNTAAAAFYEEVKADYALNGGLD